MIIATVLAAYAPRVHGASLVIDRADGRVLTSYAPSRSVDVRHAGDLLLALAVGRLLHANALARDAQPKLPTAQVQLPPLTVDELYQLFLLTRDDGARRALAATIASTAHGPAYVERLAALFAVRGAERLTHPAALERADAVAQIRLRDVARLAYALVSDPDVRRRLALDGAPLADGAVIARASSPVIAVGPPRGDAQPEEDDAVAAVIGERNGLAVLAVAAGPTASAEAFDRLQHALASYRRVTVVRKGQRPAPPVAVRGGAFDHVAAIAATELAVTRQRTSATPLVVTVQLPAAVEAPIAAGQHLGELVVEERGRVVAVVPLVAARAIAPAGWLDTARY